MAYTQSNEYCRDYRHNQKRIMVDYKGGKCQICGLVDECLAVYDFHHPDPSTKERTIQSFKCFKTAKNELDKCIMVCANCHRKIHTGERKSHTQK